jgi:rSAM/selenodomain-associated transferase 1
MSTSKEATLCVFAKRPRAGETKTRLAAELGAARAAELASCFLADTWALVGSLGWAEPVLATTDEKLGTALVGVERVWLQGAGDLGQRMERVLRRALARGGAAIALGADSPGLPARLLEEARLALAEHDAAIGPCHDGGFYLLALNRCPEGLLGELPWSAPNTFERTVERLKRSRLSVATLSPWFDVDVPADLRRLAALLASGDISAPRTAMQLARSPDGARSRPEMLDQDLDSETDENEPARDVQAFPEHGPEPAASEQTEHAQHGRGRANRQQRDPERSI